MKYTDAFNYDPKAFSQNSSKVNKATEKKTISKALEKYLEDKIRIEDEDLFKNNVEKIHKFLIQTDDINDIRRGNILNTTKNNYNKNFAFNNEENQQASFTNQNITDLKQTSEKDSINKKNTDPENKLNLCENLGNEFINHSVQSKNFVNKKNNFPSILNISYENNLNDILNGTKTDKHNSNNVTTLNKNFDFNFDIMNNRNNAATSNDTASNNRYLFHFNNSEKKETRTKKNIYGYNSKLLMNDASNLLQENNSNDIALNEQLNIFQNKDAKTIQANTNQHKKFCTTQINNFNFLKNSGNSENNSYITQSKLNVNNPFNKNIWNTVQKNILKNNNHSVDINIDKKKCDHDSKSNYNINLNACYNNSNEIFSNHKNNNNNVTIHGGNIIYEEGNSCQGYQTTKSNTNSVPNSNSNNFSSKNPNSKNRINDINNSGNINNKNNLTLNQTHKHLRISSMNNTPKQNPSISASDKYTINQINKNKNLDSNDSHEIYNNPANKEALYSEYSNLITEIGKKHEAKFTQNDKLYRSNKIVNKKNSFMSSLKSSKKLQINSNPQDIFNYTQSVKNSTEIIKNKLASTLNKTTSKNRIYLNNDTKNKNSLQVKNINNQGKTKNKKNENAITENNDHNFNSTLSNSQSTKFLGISKTPKKSIKSTSNMLSKEKNLKVLDKRDMNRSLDFTSNKIKLLNKNFQKDESTNIVLQNAFNVSLNSNSKELSSNCSRINYISRKNNNDNRNYKDESNVTVVIEENSNIYNSTKNLETSLHHEAQGKNNYENKDLNPNPFSKENAYLIKKLMSDCLSENKTNFSENDLQQASSINVFSNVNLEINDIINHFNNDINKNSDFDSKKLKSAFDIIKRTPPEVNVSKSLTSSNYNFFKDFSIKRILSNNKKNIDNQKENYISKIKDFESDEENQQVELNVEEISYSKIEDKKDNDFSIISKENHQQSNINTKNSLQSNKGAHILASNEENSRKNSNVFNYENKHQRNSEQENIPINKILSNYKSSNNKNNENFDLIDKFILDNNITNSMKSNPNSYVNSKSEKIKSNQSNISSKNSISTGNNSKNSNVNINNFHSKNNIKENNPKEKAMLHKKNSSSISKFINKKNALTAQNKSFEKFTSSIKSYGNNKSNHLEDTNFNKKSNNIQSKISSITDKKNNDNMISNINNTHSFSNLNEIEVNHLNKLLKKKDNNNNIHNLNDKKMNQTTLNYKTEFNLNINYLDHDYHTNSKDTNNDESKPNKIFKRKNVLNTSKSKTPEKNIAKNSKSRDKHEVINPLKEKSMNKTNFFSIKKSTISKNLLQSNNVNHSNLLKNSLDMNIDINKINNIEKNKKSNIESYLVREKNSNQVIDDINNNNNNNKTRLTKSKNKLGISINKDNKQQGVQHEKNYDRANLCNKINLALNITKSCKNKTFSVGKDKQNVNAKMKPNIKNIKNDCFNTNNNLNNKKTFSASKIKNKYKNIQSKFLKYHDMDNLNSTILSECDLEPEEIKELLYFPKKINPLSKPSAMNNFNSIIPRLQLCRMHPNSDGEANSQENKNNNKQKVEANVQNVNYNKSIESDKNKYYIKKTNHANNIITLNENTEKLDENKNLKINNNFENSHNLSIGNENNKSHDINDMNNSDIKLNLNFEENKSFTFNKNRNDNSINNKNNENNSHIQSIQSNENMNYAFLEDEVNDMIRESQEQNKFNLLNDNDRTSQFMIDYGDINEIFSTKK